MNLEYIIWGVPAYGEYKEEQILCTQTTEGKIKSLDVANKIKQVLETKYLCKEVRVQEINLTDNKIF
jgi:hypothetical protein